MVVERGLVTDHSTDRRSALRAAHSAATTRSAQPMAGPQAAPLVRGIAGLSKVVIRIVGWVMRLAPLGTFGALATVVAQYGASSLQQLLFGARAAAGKDERRGWRRSRPHSQPWRQPGHRTIMGR